MALDPTESVNGPDSQAGDDVNIEPRGGEQEVAEPGAERQARENAIPHSRVEEMIAKRLERERAAWQERELSPLKKQFEEMNAKLTQGQLAWLEKMGWYSPEQPKPLTREEFEAKLKEQQQNFERAQTQAYHAQRITDGWRQVQTKHPQLAKVKYFQNAVLAEYAENPNRDFMEIADEAAQLLLAHQAAVRQRESEERNAPHRRVVPAGRGGAGGGTGKSDKKQSVAEKIRSKLRESKED